MFGIRRVSLFARPTFMNMKHWMFFLALLPSFLSAQDYTIFRESAASVEEGGENVVLVAPFHPNYLISEVDRMLCLEGQDPLEIRAKLRQYVSMELTRSIGDSLDALDLRIQGEESIDIIEYVYNSLDYRYVQYEPVERKKRKIEIKLPKKKDKKTYGAYSTRRDGQLDRVEIHTDRYMSANFGNPGAVDYLQDVHAFEYIFVITQLELRRNMDKESDFPYLASLHYELMDASGESMLGAKETVYLTEDQMTMNNLKRETIPAIGKSVFAKSWEAMRPVPEEGKEMRVEKLRDNSDY